MEFLLLSINYSEFFLYIYFNEILLTKLHCTNSNTTFFNTYIATIADRIRYNTTAQALCKYLYNSCKELDLLCMWNGNIHLVFPDFHNLGSVQPESVWLVSLHCNNLLNQRGKDYAHIQEDAETSNLLSQKNNYSKLPLT